MGAGQTKQLSVLEQVNNIVNETVNKSITSITSNATASQNMEITCSDKQLELAGKANPILLAVHEKALESYYKYGAKGIPPKEPILLCTASGVSQKATVTLKSDTQSLNSMAQQITTSLQTKATQIDDLQKTTPLVGYSQTEKNTINQIITNVKNSTLNENILNIVNTAIVNQDMKISGTGVVNANQEATVSLIAGSIVENITKNISKADLEIESGQESKMEEKSGQVEAIKTVTEMISSIFKGIIGNWMLIIFCIIAVIVMFPGIFCIIPPLRIPMSILGMCSKKNNNSENKSYQIQQQPQVYYPQQYQLQQYQPQQYQQLASGFMSPPVPMYTNYIIPKNNV